MLGGPGLVFGLLIALVFAELGDLPVDDAHDLPPARGGSAAVSPPAEPRIDAMTR